MSLLENFLTYVQIDTQSDENVESNPTTTKQFNLGNLLVKQLHELGLTNAFIDEHCYVYGFLKGNQSTNICLGLIAHLDTALEMSGKDVKPQVIPHYDGSTITLNELENIKMSPDEFPNLKKVIGHTIITTNGKTLLGADDKAGVAIIMEVVKTLLQNPELPHPNIIITFTPDEEVGMGTNAFNYEYYNEHHCNFAYTLDGGNIEEINYENFNAASATIEFFGTSIHPGSAKNKMVNSQLLAHQFQNYLPENARPEYTENYEGFYHLTSINGSVEYTIMQYIIRNHDMKLFREQINYILQIQKLFEYKYGKEAVKITIQDSYYNMKELVLKHPKILEYPKKALIELGLHPYFSPIRGGTDGARLSFNGIVTPNLGTGGENFHGKYEYISLDNMKKMVQVLLKIFSYIK